MAIKGGIGLYSLQLHFFYFMEIYIEVLLLGDLLVMSCCTISFHRILVAHSNVSSANFSDHGFAGSAEVTDWQMVDLVPGPGLF